MYFLNKSSATVTICLYGIQLQMPGFEPLTVTAAKQIKKQKSSLI